MNQLRNALGFLPCCRRRGEWKMDHARYDTVDHIKIALFDMAIFLALLFSATFVVVDSNEYAYQLNDLMVNIFVKRKVRFNMDKEIQFTDIKTKSVFYDYMDLIFLEAIHRDFYQNDFQLKKRTIDKITSNIFITPILIRQVRVNDESCQIMRTYPTKLDKCFGKYTTENEYKEPRWKGTSWLQDKRAPVVGHFATYVGPGYFQKLHHNHVDNLHFIRKLRLTNWIDGGTRLVLTEFGVYAANMDFFCIIKLYTEFTTVGAIIPYYEIGTYKLYRGFGKIDETKKLCYYICLVCLIYMCIEELLGILDKKFNHFENKWNYVDIAIIAVGWTIFWILTKRKKTFDIVYDQIKTPGAYFSLHENAMSYVDMDNLVYYENLYRVLTGVFILLVWAKIFKYIALTEAMQVFSATISKCGDELLSFAIMFLLIFLGFATLSYLIFGAESYGFRSFKDSFITMIKISVGTFHYLTLEDKFPILAPLFYLIYLILVPYILLNMFLVIVDDTYKKIQSKEIRIAPTYFVLFLKNALKGAKINIDALSRKGGDDEKLIKGILPTEYMQKKKKLVPEYFEIVESEAGSIEKEVEQLDLRITRNEELYTKLSRGLDRLIYRLCEYKRSH